MTCAAFVPLSDDIAEVNGLIEQISDELRRLYSDQVSEYPGYLNLLATSLFDKLQQIRHELSKNTMAHLKQLDYNGNGAYLHIHYHNLTLYADFIPKNATPYFILREAFDEIKKTIEEHGYYVDPSKLRFYAGCEGNMRCSYWTK